MEGCSLDNGNLREIVEAELADAREIVDEARKLYMQGLKNPVLEAIPCFEPPSTSYLIMLMRGISWVRSTVNCHCT